MGLDSITLNHLIKELHPTLVGARLDKIQQPEKEEIHILLRLPGKSLRLLLNAGSTSARIHLTEQTKKNPVSPPMFCMILRKHLEGGKILNIEQVGLERIVTLTVQNYNDRGDLQDYSLNLEIMGKHSNLILVDSSSNTILDGIKRYSHALSRHREVLPGKTYISPPGQNKTEPLSDEHKFMSRLLEFPLERKVSDALLHLFNGISPELAKEIVLRARLHPDTVCDSCGEIDLSRIYQAYSLFILNKNNAPLKPGIYYPSAIGKNLPVAFTLTPYEQYAHLTWQGVSTLNEAVDLFHLQKMSHNKNEARKGSLRKIAQDHYNHLRKKCDIYEETIAKAQKNLGHRRFGELLTANLYSLSPGLTEITVDDYTDPEYKPLTIPLDPNLSGIDNSQRYFKLYNKGKSTIQKTEPFLQAALEETEYLQTLLLSIDQSANDTELNEIYQELVDQGYVSGKQVSNAKKPGKKSTGRKKEPEKHSRPWRYLSATGKIIIAGHNNKQNDRLTWREAKPSDLWLHVKKIPGSHVIVPLDENEEFPDDITLLEAAALAVYFSQARGSSHVPVDYTHVRQIKKPRGAKPGMVIYEQNWSLITTPEQETIERLLATEHNSAEHTSD